jgi:hypothetical protein
MEDRKMNALYDLRDMIVEQLEDYGKRGELSSSVLEKVDVLAHAAKNLDKVIEGCEGETEYSKRGRSYNNFGNSGRSYRRRHSRRGRYSGDDDLMEELYSMMDEEPDEQKRQNLQRLASKMEQM